MPEHYITAGGKRLRCGRTTGTCAAMAAAGAVRLLLTGRAPDLISLNTPRDWMVEAPLLDCVADGETAACSVEKDGGDDVDATHGLPIRATVRRRAEGGTAILGGPGVGRVTRPGLRAVREMGLEPTRPQTQEPKSCASTSSATRARRPRGQGPSYAGAQAILRSRRSLATWPVALTLYCARRTRPSAPTTTVERMTPVTIFP